MSKELESARVTQADRERADRALYVEVSFITGLTPEGVKPPSPTERVAQAIADAREAERERCAKVADEAQELAEAMAVQWENRNKSVHEGWLCRVEEAKQLAAAIRRGEQEDV